MHRVGPDLVFSATDLASYAGCAQRTWLDRLKALGLDEPERFGPDLRLQLLQERGIEHERAYLERLEGEGKRVVRFGPIAKEERSPEGYRGKTVGRCPACVSGGVDQHQFRLSGKGYRDCFRLSLVLRTVRRPAHEVPMPRRLIVPNELQPSRGYVSV
jgi:hypothetical protein